MMRLGASQEDFQKAYDSYGGAIKRTLRAMTGSDAIAEELTQEAFTKAWVNLPLFSFKSSLKTWIYKVAINVGRDWLRSSKNRELPKEISDSDTAPHNDEREDIQEALDLLNHDSREILVLFYYEEMSLNEIAKVLTLPLGTVKSRLHISRLKLKDLLIEKGYDV